MNTRLAVVFDFDDTLAHDSTSAFLASVGVDVPAFWKDTVQPLLAGGWDPMPAYMHAMVELSRSRPAGDRITRDRLAAFGPKVTLYPGVAEVFDHLRAAARAEREDAEVEFYCISSGIGDIVRHTPVSSQFRRVFSGEFATNEAGEIIFPKRLVSFTEKTRFLFAISKGVDDVNRRVDPETYRVPMSRIIFVGDGMTDVPCFSLVKRYDGVPVGVYDPNRPDKWGEKYDSFIGDRRVAGAYSANYQPGSDLHSFLLMAVRAIVRKI